MLLKSILIGGVLLFAPLTEPITITEKLDGTVYIQATLERAPYVWVPQEQMDDLPASSGTISVWQIGTFRLLLPKRFYLWAQTVETWQPIFQEGPIIVVGHFQAFMAGKITQQLLYDNLSTVEKAPGFPGADLQIRKTCGFVNLNSEAYTSHRRFLYY